MAVPVQSNQDFAGVARIVNLPNAVAAQEPSTLAQLLALTAGQKTTQLVVRDRFTLLPTDAAMAVDVSDVTMDPTGTNVQVSLAEQVASGAVGYLGMQLVASAGMLRNY